MNSGESSLFLAMAHWQLGEKPEAQADFDHGSQWLKEYEQRCVEAEKKGHISDPPAHTTETSPSRSGGAAGRDYTRCRNRTRTCGESRGGEGAIGVAPYTGCAERRGATEVT